MNSDRQQWERIISANYVQTQEAQLKQLACYHDMLVEWNLKINLISRKDQTNVWPSHILHSLSPLFMLSIPERITVADIGSGGGLPGIPFAIMLPTAKVIMVESMRKKADALNDMISRLGLSNAMVVNSRAEELGKSLSYRYSIDMIIARAVAPLKELIKWSIPLARKKSDMQIKIRQNHSNESHRLPVIVALKGGDLGAEITEAGKLVVTGMVRSFDLRFDGIEKTDLFEKKIVIVGLS